MKKIIYTGIVCFLFTGIVFANNDATTANKKGKVEDKSCDCGERIIANSQEFISPLIPIDCDTKKTAKYCGCLITKVTSDGRWRGAVKFISFPFFQFLCKGDFSGDGLKFTPYYKKEKAGPHL